MAMGGFDNEDLQAPLAEINTTPLVDVMLVLLVIFLVTAPMLTQAVQLELPNETATQVPNKKVITVSIDASGAYYWDDEPINEETLDARLQVAAGENPKQPVYLRADTDVAYGKVSHFLAAAQKLGMNNIGFLTLPQP